ncbi:MAG: PilZ domain-containing protein [Gammaproteobacteria bacterium]|nr:PilZ domain-containing protein [Gammaproteobacteria bacterium]MDH5692146.1 PilZ domain-containing protein [Gammaproteobacteria bacterium]
MQASHLNERRRFSRVGFDAAVTVTGAMGSWTGKLIDISLKGMLISRPHQWHSPKGGRFLVEVHPPENPFNIRMEMVVAHTEDNQIGLECVHIDLDSISHLRRLVELNIGDDQVLHRELAAMTN